MRRYLNRVLLLVIVTLLLPLGAIAQQDSTAVAKPKKWQLHGYVKYLPSVNFVPPPQGSMIQNNLIHNRFNFEWYPSQKWTFKASLRTRLFFGEQVKLVPNYGDLIKQSSLVANGYDDPLSWTLLDEKAAVLHSTLDRLSLQYSNGKWDITLGRQRINWGINTIWNPNDIFNTYSFTDFDYEERPGSDALHIQYYTGVTSSIEFAAKAFTKWGDATAAFLWKTNKWEYDFQLLGGIAQQDIVVGGGWAGSLGLVGFKGEVSYFYNYRQGLATNQRHSVTATMAWDYLFPNRIYFSAGLLYNSNGNVQGSITQLFGSQPTAKNLYPYRYAISLSASYPFTEKINAGVTAVYSPGESHAVFLSPNFSYLINEQWDIAFISQLVFNAENGYYTSPLQSFFLRIRISF